MHLEGPSGVELISIAVPVDFVSFGVLVGAVVVAVFTTMLVVVSMMISNAMIVVG